MADAPLLITDGSDHKSAPPQPPAPPPAPAHVPRVEIPRDRAPLGSVFVGPKIPPPEPQAPSDGLPRIRTYAADLSEEIRERGATLSSIVTAEQAKRPVIPSVDPNMRRRTLLMAGGALALIIIGVGSVTAALVFRHKDEPIVLTTSIIFSNSTTKIDLVSDHFDTLLAGKRENDKLSLGEVERIAIASQGAPVAPQDIARALGIPDTIARDVTDAMVGVHAFDRTQPFVILKIGAYDRVFGALLKWEPDMARGLGAFFAPRGGGTPPTLTFKDTIIDNLDVRVSQSAWPILYAFPAQNLLVITTNEYTLREVLTRLQNAN